MKGVAVLCLLVVPSPASAQPAIEARLIQEIRFTGPSARADLCACLLETRQLAESQGRINFSADVVTASSAASTDLTARIWMGSAYAVGRIAFAGHTTVNDSTLRRALLVSERELLDAGRLRRSLTRINALGLFEPLTLADLEVTRRDDGVTADVTIPLRERRRRWWSLSGPLVPGVSSFQASLASRLPPWGRGVFEASTYVVRLNLLGLIVPVARGAPLLLERPVVPGQEWLSGFAVSPGLSPRAMLTHYARTHAARGVDAVLGTEPIDALIVPVVSTDRPDGDTLVCEPPKPRLWWLRRGGALAASLALTALLP